MKILLGIIFLILSLAFVFLRPENMPEIKPESPIQEENKEAAPPKKESVPVSISSPPVLQGEPALITLDAPLSPADIASLTLSGQSLDLFEEGGRLAALVGIDLHRKPGAYPILLTLRDGAKTEATLEVRERVMATTTFDIPEKLGGNTPEAEQALTNSLSQDTATLNTITRTRSGEKLWSGEFRYPLDGTPFVTDTYGYSRQTGSVNLSHNGTDFRAALGTPVFAMNAGTVVFNGSFRNYGNTVVIDHGLGVMTLYMHLSKAKVELGQRVKKGDQVAESGNTGYSLGPHLHLSVRIDGFSLDPMKFLELLGPK